MRTKALARVAGAQPSQITALGESPASNRYVMDHPRSRRYFFVGGVARSLGLLKSSKGHRERKTHRNCLISNTMRAVAE